MKYLTIAALAAGASAFPAVTAPAWQELDRRAGVPLGTNEPNSGFTPNTEPGRFQDVRPGSGHEFKAPKVTEVRGPCPGLNAMANHGFISRTGVLDFKDTTEGIPTGLGLSPEFGTILFFFSVFNSGSLVDMKWSIGGPFATTTLGVLGPARGISNTHNKYDGDSSPGRGDAYLHNGDSHSLNIPNFSQLYNDPDPDGYYSMAALRRQANRAHTFTVQNNPYGFYGPAAVVPPIAHQFVATFMANYSKPHIQGRLTKEMLRSFFSVKEHKDGTLEWIPGHDRMPNNWYVRPRSNYYGTFQSFADLGVTCAQTPQICEFGGNLGKPNTFVGLDPGDVTGGVITGANLLKGNNLACFGIEGLTFVVPGLAEALLTQATKATRDFQNILGKTKTKLGCPQLTEYDVKKFNRYPGFTWQQPEQPATPY